MSEISNIDEIIKAIPVLLEYLVPGYIFMTIRSFSLSKNQTNDNHIIIKSVVLSFIFLEIIYPIVLRVFTYIGFKGEFVIFAFIFLIIVISILYMRFNIEEYLVKTLGNGKTTKDDCLDVVLSGCSKDGVIARVYLESEELIYTGSLVYYDNKFSMDNRSIALAGYTLHSFDGDEIYNYEGIEKNIVVLNTKDIKRIEILK